MDLGQQLQQAMEASGASLYAIAKETGLEYSTVYRFAHGQRDICLQTASVLASHLGLTLAKSKRLGAKGGC